MRNYTLVSIYSPVQISQPYTAIISTLDTKIEANMRQPIANHRRILFCLLMCMFLPSCLSQVQPQQESRQTNDLADIVKSARQFSQQFANEDILVIFDLDNTLLTMQADLGSVPWYDWQSDIAKTPGCQPGELDDRLAAQGILYFLGSMQPLQENSSALVQTLPKEGYKSLVLTARGQSFRASSIRELTRQKMQFTDLLNTKNLQDTLLFTPTNASREVSYGDGVLMVAGQHKGNMLQALYSELELTLPKAIVMVDDSTDNLSDMQQTLGVLGIQYHLYHYNRAEQRVAEFDSVQATNDWNRLLPAIETMQSIMTNSQLPAINQLHSCDIAY